MTIEEVIEEYEHNLDYTNRSYANTRLEVSIESYASQQISKVISEIEENLPLRADRSGEHGDTDKFTAGERSGINDTLDQVHKVLEEYKK